MNRRFMMMGVGAVKQGRLPAEYQEVSYIESSGTQYIDTGVNANLQTELYLHCYTYAASTDNGMFGATTNKWEQNSFGMIVGNYDLYYVIYDSTTFKTITSSYGEMYITLGKNKITFEGPTLYTSTFTNTTQFNTLSLWLFNIHEPVSSVSGRPMRLYSCTIKENDTLIRDFVPCYRKSDNKIGLYDTVNDVFYTNANTNGSDFTKGGDVA